jgi:hypothetical protein
MASKIHTDNPKHHKYVTTNKQERKKFINNIIFNCFTKLYDITVLVRERIISYGWNTTEKIISKFRVPNYHSSYRSCLIDREYHSEHIGQKGCVIVYDDCNHRKYRVVKDGKYIKTSYYGNTKHFKR